MITFFYKSKFPNLFDIEWNRHKKNIDWISFYALFYARCSFVFLCFLFMHKIMKAFPFRNSNFQINIFVLNLIFYVNSKLQKRPLLKAQCGCRCRTFSLSFFHFIAIFSRAWIVWAKFFVHICHIAAKNKHSQFSRTTAGINSPSFILGKTFFVVFSWIIHW